MKSKKKIDILSPEEMRQETIDSAATQKAKGNCTISRECANGRQVACSGATCKEEYETVGGKKVLKFIECLDEDGYLINYEACDNSSSGSGSSGTSGTANSPEAACKNSTFGASCEWIDATGLPQYGTCQYDYNSPQLKLICKQG